MTPRVQPSELQPSQEVADCSGLCFPGPPGSVTDELMVRDAEAVGRDAAALAATEPPAAGVVPPLAETLDRLDAVRRARLFAGPLARLDTAPATPDELPDPRSREDRARILFRHLIGHPDAPEQTIVLAPGAIAADGLVLPHVGALFCPHPELPTAIRQSDQAVRFIRGDGASVTLPLGRKLPANFVHPILTSLPQVCDLPVLNASAEVAATFAEFELAQGEALAAAIARLAEGVAVLGECWPEAAAALRRHAEGFVLLAPRGFERSHTPQNLRGAILLTATDVQAIGDLLCHEASHLRMLPFLGRDPLVAADPEADRIGFASPWRPDPRPLRGVLLGVHAFLNVCGFHRRLSRHPAFTATAHAVVDRQKNKLRLGLSLLQAHGKPSRLGGELMREMSVAVEQLEGGFA